MVSLRARTASLRTFLAIFLAVVLFAAAIAIPSALDAHENCKSTQHDWDAFDRVISAAVNPPSRAGVPLTQEQQTALNTYRSDLETALGPRPNC